MKMPEVIEDSWDHYCLDDNGHVFSFFWQSLESDLDESWHPLFKGAIDFIKVGVKNTN